jgi:hypothetical protein
MNAEDIPIEWPEDEPGQELFTLESEPAQLFPMKVIDGGTHKMLLFATGRVYKCFKDRVTECIPKVEIIIDPATFKVYKHAYIHFNFSRYSLAKLIATAFVDNPNGYKKLRRIDGDASNNAASNLQWVANNCQYPTIAPAMLAAINPKELGIWNRSVLTFLLTDDDTNLYGYCFGGSLYKYFYRALRNNGVPNERLSLYMESGYELLKRRLRAYYLPHSGKYGENRFRKYAYFCYVYQAMAEMKRSFVPRELKSKKDSDEVFDYL